MVSDRCSCYGRCNHDEMEPVEMTIEASDSHNVHFRDEDDQPCPNCGAVVEKFEETSRYDTWGGYECSECDVRWDWEEWADGVQKLPDPDPQHEVADLENRLIGHAYRDIMHAIEDGAFAVETPRGHVRESTFERVDISLERDVNEHHSRDGLAAVSVGTPYITMKLEWSPADTNLLDDLAAHARLEGPCVIHGQMHLWRMDEPLGQVQSWVMRDGTSPAAEAEFSWHAVEDAGWV
jgi:predicted RNA-binding Zn-ribbon protein involved in translation (DUF1610 family)